MWTTSSGISTDTAIYCFRRCCRYEPLSAKLRRVSRDNISIAELFDIALRRLRRQHDHLQTSGRPSRRQLRRPRRRVDRQAQERRSRRLGQAWVQAATPPPGVFLDVLTRSSVHIPREIDIAEPPAPDSALVALASDAGDWTEPYLSYLERQVLPTDETEAHTLVRRCKSFTIINNELYKRNISGIFQRCVTANEGRKILRDIHAGDCGHHAGARSIVAKAFRHGFYWPTAHDDAMAIVRACAGCQKYASQSHMPGSALKTIPLTWPFAVWGMDMVENFKTAPGGYTHLLVAVDKFTKWIEAKPIKKCDSKTATKFLRELIYRYGYPHSIITDNGTNFAKGEMVDFCEEKGIRLDLAAVAHPESNGQAERANQSIDTSNLHHYFVP
ncbi:hypothetical protein QYE76_007730 [Lolium multiflorum]|uniref:Integrase catalytic domain-containing protein n=1 Tax=Lolium multiflorum TaxID=4521 RepID=A0AAD8QIF0_LOLMU|nr:hypothetical protein QYE76_007730 [Lolium multiflorum]